MIWTTDKINQLKSLIDSGDSIKSIIRDITIDSVLDEESTTEIVFPFVTKKDKVNTKYRNSDILFRYTDDEIRKILYYDKNPNEFFEDIVSTSFLRSSMKIPVSFRRYFLEQSRESRFIYTNVPSRKLGTTSLLSFLAYYHLIFNKTQLTYDIMILSSDDRHLIHDYIKEMYESTPFFMKPGLIEIKEDRLKFDRGCITISNTPNMAFGRGSDMIIIDDFYNRSVYNTLIPLMRARRDSMMIIASTNKNDDIDSSIFNAIDMRDFIRENNLDEFTKN